MKVLALLLLAITLSGCMVTDRPDLIYTRSEVDALAARMECRAMARNMVQIARCDGR